MLQLESDLALSVSRQSWSSQQGDDINEQKNTWKRKQK